MKLPPQGRPRFKAAEPRVENRLDQIKTDMTHREPNVHTAIIDEAELGQLAKLVARLTPGQQRLLVALADGFRGGWLEPFQWERAWRGLDLSNDGVLSDARTWLARRPREPHDRLRHTG